MATRRCRACGKKRTPGERFHRFPVHNPELCRKWIINAKLLDFLPTENDILCADHFDATAYKYPGAQRLDDNAVPTIFVHTQTIERKPPMKRPLPVVVNNDDDEKPAKLIHVDSSSTKDDLKVVIIKQDAKLNKKRKEIKTLKQKVRRKEAKVMTLQNLKDIKEKGLMAPSIADCLSENFQGLTGELISNHFSNMNRKQNGVRYVDDVKKFALTLHFYSPRAYEYVRKVFRLPHSRSIRAWTSSIRCEPGFFDDVFQHLKLLVLELLQTMFCTGNKILSNLSAITGGRKITWNYSTMVFAVGEGKTTTQTCLNSNLH